MYTLLVLFFFVSIVFSFLCSIWEAVLLSISPSFTETEMQKGGPLGQSLQSFKENIDRPLAAILTLNTIAHTVGAIGVGAQATKIWGASFMASAVVPVAMTLAILLLSEIIPKTIGANYWKELAGFTARSLNIIMTVLAPLVWLSQLITRVLKKDKSASVFSRADFTAMAELGSREGVLDPSESTILRNLLRFDTVLAEHVMTPRTVVVSADENTTTREFHEAHPVLRFSRIPVYEGSNDHVTGYVLKDAILKSLVDNDGEQPLAVFRRDITVVRQDTPIPNLFDQFTTRHEHIALVVDQFGGMAGIVTMEDVIETLIGLEIVDEQDGSTDMQALARTQWERRATRMGVMESLNEEIKRRDASIKDASADNAPSGTDPAPGAGKE